MQTLLPEFKQMPTHHPSRTQLETHLQAVQHDFIVPGALRIDGLWLRERLAMIVAMAANADRAHMQALVDAILAGAGPPPR